MGETRDKEIERVRSTELGRKEKKGKSDRVGERVKCFNYWTVMQHSGYESYLLINIEIKTIKNTVN